MYRSRSSKCQYLYLMKILIMPWNNKTIRNFMKSHILRFPWASKVIFGPTFR
jgi:hypothetical protein